MLLYKCVYARLKFKQFSWEIWWWKCRFTNQMDFLGIRMKSAFLYFFCIFNIIGYLGDSRQSVEKGKCCENWLLWPGRFNQTKTGERDNSTSAVTAVMLAVIQAVTSTLWRPGRLWRQETTHFSLQSPARAAWACSAGSQEFNLYEEFSEVKKYAYATIFQQRQFRV